MKSWQPIDQTARDLDAEVKQSTYLASKIKTEKRMAILEQDYADADILRETAGNIKQHTIENLDTYLLQAEEKLKKNGVHVHFACDAQTANETVLKIIKDNDASSMVKSKSMVTEEIEMLPFLEKSGMDIVETDLGEFIVQIDNDHPSHIVTPIIHKNRRQIAESFEREGLGERRCQYRQCRERAAGLVGDAARAGSLRPGGRNRR